MKEKTTGKKRIAYYIVLAVSVALLITAIALTVYFVAGPSDTVLDNPNNPSIDNPNNPGQDKPDQPNPDQPNPDKPNPDKPTTGDDTVQFVNPLASVTLQTNAEFYHNQTLGWYYFHEGVDIAAKGGDDVFAMAAGTVVSIVADETLVTEIVIDHGNGVHTVYCMVEAVEGLKKGDSVKSGQKIATVVEGKGMEYKDGAHLHLEVEVNGEQADPVKYLTLSEK